MKRIMLVILACVGFTITKSQPQAPASESKILTPQERYLLMKTKSETYQDFKVVKESFMDGVWKIVNDTLNKREGQLAAASAKIKALQDDVAAAKSALKSKEDSMTDVVFKSEHINAAGINFSKGRFLALIVFSAAALLVTIFLLLTRINSMQAFVKESKVIVASTSNEFEDYKRKSFEKQTKLTRELQTERNKLNELKEAMKVKQN